MKEFVRPSYHITYTQTHMYESIHCYFSFSFRYSFTIHQILYVHAFIISDLPTICTCHNNLRLTYRNVEDFSSKIFFTIIYTAFSAANQWFNHLVFFPLFYFLLHVRNLRMYSTKILYRKKDFFFLFIGMVVGSFLLIYIGVQVE